MCAKACGMQAPCASSDGLRRLRAERAHIRVESLCGEGTQRRGERLWGGHTVTWGVCGGRVHNGRAASRRHADQQQESKHTARQANRMCAHPAGMPTNSVCVRRCCARASVLCKHLGLERLCAQDDRVVLLDGRLVRIPVPDLNHPVRLVGRARIGAGRAARLPAVVQVVHYALSNVDLAAQPVGLRNVLGRFEVVHHTLRVGEDEEAALPLEAGRLGERERRLVAAKLVKVRGDKVVGVARHFERLAARRFVA
eukprot:300891-Chlamydomonas_euryale.AAC.6